MLAWLGFVIGVVAFLTTIGSVVETTVVPRGTRSRITRVVAGGVQAVFQFIADRSGRWEHRDRVWSLSGPTFLMSLLVAWLSLLVGELTLVMAPFVDGSLADAFRAAGSAVFTLGGANPGEPVPTVFVFIGAASGLVVVALQIAYLPTLYAAYNRREVPVTLLDWLAGAPAWGPEILARFALVDGLADLDDLYRQWTTWSADISESHAAYRSLIYFRSPTPARSWVIAQLAVLDAAALHLALWPSVAPFSARRALRVGSLSLQQVAAAVRLPPTPSPADVVSDLTDADILAAIDVVAAAGLAVERTTDAERAKAVADFRGWRVNYEPAAYGLAEHIDSVPALWSGPRRRRGERLAPMRPERPGLD